MRKRIAVLNDSQDFLDLMELVLQTHGPYDVHRFFEVRTTVEQVRAVRPSLILVDPIGAPEFPGFALAADIGHDLVLAAIPMIVCSAPFGRFQREFAELEQRANVSILHKPFELDDLRRLVDGLLGRATPREERA